jgi:hypothetical protein
MANNYQNFQFNPQGSSQFTQSTNNPLNQPVLQNQINQPYPGQIVFPQPVGNVYNLNSANDIGNIPFGGNVSVGLCLSENIIYIKSLQNGIPMLLGYKLNPIENLNSTTQTVSNSNSDNRLEELIATLNENNKKIDLLEKQVIKLKEKIGGKTEWQI